MKSRPGHFRPRRRIGLLPEKKGRWPDTSPAIHGRTLRGRVRDLEKRLARAEARTIAADMRYNALLEGIQDAVFIHRISGSFFSSSLIEVNEAACKRLGYSRDELLSLTPKDVDAPEMHGRAAELMKQLIRKGHLLFDMVHIARDGTRIPVEINARVIRIGADPYVLAIARDARGRLKSEAALRKSEAILRETQQMARIGGWELDLVAGRLFWTDEVFRIHEVEPGFTPTLENAVGFYHPDDRPAIGDAVRRASETGEPWDLELRLVTATGKHIWVRAMGKATWEDGRPVRLAGTFQDITPKKVAQEALKESEARFRLLVEHLPAVVYAASADTDSTTLYVSPRIRDLTGYDPGAFIGNPEMFPKILHPEDRERVMEAVGRSHREQTSLDMEYRVIRRNGRTIWVRDIAGVLRDDKGAAREIQGVLFDITAQKMAENDLIQARRKAEEASQTKSMFLATVSHELRTPLNAIIGFSEVLADELFGVLNPKQKAYVNNVLASGRHLLHLINDILDLSKVESGRMDMVWEEVSLSGLLLELMVMFREEAAHKQISLSLSLEDSIKETLVLADERKLTQIMFNLLSNAVKFTPRRGEIRIRVERNGSLATIRVVDSGPGIAEKDLESIFEAFMQSRSQKPESKGTGLGLSLARSLAELHGGRVWAENNETGAGSRFIFEFPLRCPQGEAYLDGRDGAAL